MGTHAGQQHTSAGTHALYPLGIFKHCHNPVDILVPKECQGLVNGRLGQTTRFQIAAFGSVHGNSALPQTAGSEGGGVLGKFDLKGIEALQLQTAAEP